MTEVEDRGRPSAIVQAAARSRMPAPAVAGVRMALEPGRGRTATPIRSALVATTFALAALTAALGFARSFDHLSRTPRLSGWNWDAAAGTPFADDLSQCVVPRLRSSSVVAGLAAGNDSAVVELRGTKGRRITTKRSRGSWGRGWVGREGDG